MDEKRGAMEDNIVEGGARVFPTPIPEADDTSDEKADERLYKRSSLSLSDDEHSTRDHALDPVDRPRTSLIFWIVVNIASTVSITFVNKALFADTTLRKCQLLLAAYHLFLTWLTLHIASSSTVSVFSRRYDLRIRSLLPLAVSMASSVVLTNSSLAHCSIPFFQTVRVLLTPCVALLNYLLYGSTIPWLARWTLLPVCIGAAIMAVFDVKQSRTQTQMQMQMQMQSQTSSLGVMLALISLLTSSIYTVWVAFYHSKFTVQSHQLLHRQSPVSALLLAVAIPFFDTLPSSFGSITTSQYLLIAASGVCASMINLSQFFILGAAGPTAGTVVGHAKTVLIVVLGWVHQGLYTVNVQSLAGCLLAIAGIVLYSMVTIYESKFGGR